MRWENRIYQQELACWGIIQQNVYRDVFNIKKKHHHVLQVRSFIVPYDVGQRAEEYGNADVTEAAINQHPSPTLTA